MNFKFVKINLLLDLYRDNISVIIVVVVLRAF